jgi:hypothetical protein
VQPVIISTIFVLSVEMDPSEKWERKQKEITAIAPKIAEQMIKTRAERTAEWEKQKEGTAAIKQWQQTMKEELAAIDHQWVKMVKEAQSAQSTVVANKRRAEMMEEEQVPEPHLSANSNFFKDFAQATPSSNIRKQLAKMAKKEQVAIKQNGKSQKLNPEQMPIAIEVISSGEETPVSGSRLSENPDFVNSAQVTPRSAIMKKRWAKITEKEGAAIGQKIAETRGKKWWAKMTEEKRTAAGPKQAEATKKRWAKMTEEERAAIGQKIAEAAKKRWAKMTEEERAAAGQKQVEAAKKRWAKKTKEARSIIGKKIAETRAKNTEKEWAKMAKEKEIREKRQLSAPVDEDQEYDVSRNEPSKEAVERDDCFPLPFPEENSQEGSFLSALLSVEDPTDLFSKWGIVLTDSLLPDEPFTPLFP